MSARDVQPLWRRAAARVVVVVVLWAVAALVLYLRLDADRRIDLPAAPAEGVTSKATPPASAPSP